jgi:hypothetical protein
MVGKNKDRGRFHDLTILLLNLEKRKHKFSPDEQLVADFLSYVKPFRENANANAHSIIKASSQDEILKLNVPNMVGLLKRILDRL